MFIRLATGPLLLEGITLPTDATSQKKDYKTYNIIVVAAGGEEQELTSVQEITCEKVSHH